MSSRSRTLTRILFAGACLAIVGGEATALFVERTVSLRTEGEKPILLSQFRDGAAVEHGFLMAGDGLKAVSVRFEAERPTSMLVSCVLSLGDDANPEARAEIYRWTQTVEARSGGNWKRFDFPSVGASNNRYYKFKIRLLDAWPAGPIERARPHDRPPIAIVASTDNPPRGGALWIDEVRQPGSLYLRAHNEGDTRYGRFRLETEPKLPALLRRRSIQIALALAYHVALLTFAYVTLFGAHDTRRRRLEPSARPTRMT